MNPKPHSIRQSVLVALAVVAGGSTFLAPLGQESVESASQRFLTALRSQDSHELYSFVSAEEREALKLDEAEFGRLLQHSLYSLWDTKGAAWNFRQIKENGAMHVEGENQNPHPHSRLLSFYVCGSPGSYRTPSMVMSVLKLASARTFGGDAHLPKQKRLNAYVARHRSELHRIGLTGFFDEYRGQVRTFDDVAGPKSLKLAVSSRK